MIIDSHAHYAHGRYDNEFPYLCIGEDGYAILRADREGLLSSMQKQGVVGLIEAGIGFDAIEKQLALTAQHKDFMWATIGVHPTRCIHTAFKNRKHVREYAENNFPIAIGETGLDYHYPRIKQKRLRQKMWFVYQIKLADHLGLPLVLHIREADRSALKLLKKYRSKLHGGVAHCFSGSAALAEEYIALGFSLGIGGKLLCDDATGRELCETVKRVPLSSLLVETDAPFVMPDIGALECSRNQRKKLCNSSLILPAVIQKIAEIRGECYETVEQAIYQNTVNVFKLPL